MATLTELRQALGFALNEITVGTQKQPEPPEALQGVLQAFFRDGDLRDALLDASQYKGAWAYQPSNGEERRILDFIPADGTVHLVRNWMASWPERGYEIHQLMPASELNGLINQALASITYLAALELPVWSGEREYPLDEFTYLTQPGQVYAVEFAQAAEDGGYRYQPLVHWEIKAVEGSLYLLVDPFGEGSGNLLRLSLLRNYDVLASEAAETTCPTEWALAVTRPLVWERLMRKAPAEDAKRYEREWAREMALMQRLAYRYVPAPNRQVKLRPAGRYSDSSIVRWP